MDLWRASGVPARHSATVAAGLTVESWPEQDQPAVRRVVEALAANGLVALLGPWGSGKTQLAAWCIYGCCTSWGRPALYRRWADLIAEIRGEAYKDGGSDSRPLARLTNLGLLVIDEIHERRWTDDENLWLGRVLDHRYGAMRPTILVANLIPSELRNVLSPAVIDRMREGGAVVELTGPTQRKSPTPPTRSAKA